MDKDGGNMKKIILIVMACLLIGCSNTKVVEVNNSPTVETSLEENHEVVIEEEVSMDGYEFAGTLFDKSKVYYKAMDAYYKLERASEIVILKDNQVTTVESGELSVPVVSPDKKQLAFVSGVGFELKGTLKLYKDDALMVFDSGEIAGLDDKSRTIKSCVWLDQSHVLSLIGYDTGSISQGGDVYSIDLESGALKMIIDSKEGFEIAAVSYEEDVLKYTTVAWEKGNYSVYEYYDEEVILSEARLPIKVDWKPWNLDKEMLTALEILNLPVFNPNTTVADMAGLENQLINQVTSYEDAEVIYDFKPEDDQVWRIISKGNLMLPRNIMTGQTLDEVLSLFPQMYKYSLTDEGVFYGELSEDSLKQSFAGTLQGTELYDVMNFYTDTKYPNLRLYFENSILVKAEVYFYE